MILSILFIIALVVLSLCINYRNRMLWVFSGYFLGIGILLFASSLYLAKISNYYNQLRIDYNLYLMFCRIKLSILDASRIFNFGIAIIMVSSVLFFVTVKKKRGGKTAITGIPIVIFLWANDPSTFFKAYLQINSFSNTIGKQAVPHLLKLNNIFSISIIIIYFTLPFYVMFMYGWHTKIRLKIKYSIVTCICFAIIDLFIISLFFIGQFNSLMPWNVDLFKHPINEFTWKYSAIMPPVIMIALIMVLYLTFYYKPFNNFYLLSKRDMLKNSQMFNKNLRMIFHVYKNLFFAIERLSNQSEQFIETKPAITISNLQDINKIAFDSVTTINRMLNMLSEVKANSYRINVVDCIKNALGKVYIPPNVSIKNENTYDEVIIYADSFQLTECFVNLFDNALDAIKLKDKNNGFIRICVTCEDDLVSIEIIDNGCGIDKKNIKNIFKVLYSTKQNSKNWGVGLNYVEKVIRVYHGHIFVNSEEEKYTTFQIVMPLILGK